MATRPEHPRRAWVKPANGDRRKVALRSRFGVPTSITRTRRHGVASRLGERHWVESRRTVNDDDLRQWADVRLVTLGRAFDDHLRMYVRQPITRRMNGNRWSQVRAGQGITAP